MLTLRLVCHHDAPTIETINYTSARAAARHYLSLGSCLEAQIINEKGVVISIMTADIVRRFASELAIDDLADVTFYTIVPGYGLLYEETDILQAA